MELVVASLPSAHRRERGRRRRRGRCVVPIRRRRDSRGGRDEGRPRTHSRRRRDRRGRDDALHRRGHSGEGGAGPDSITRRLRVGTRRGVQG